MTAFKILSFMLIASVAFSCQVGEAPAFDTKKLTGRWELTKAWRNHRPTETLTGTFYEFLQDGLMKTNLVLDGSNGEYPFVVSGSKIIQKSKPDEVVFTVVAFSDTLLTLEMVMKNYPFKLVLHKVEQEAEFNAQ